MRRLFIDIAPMLWGVVVGCLAIGLGPMATQDWPWAIGFIVLNIAAYTGGVAVGR